MTLSMRFMAPFALFVAIVAGVKLTGSDSSDHVQPPLTVRSPSASPSVDAPVQNSSTSTTHSMDPRTAAKYRYLLEQIDLKHPAFHRVAALLQAREHSTHDDSTGEPNDVERELLSLLDPAQHALYFALRDSDPEQSSLNDFAAGIANDTPLTESQRRDALLAKLRHKRDLELWREQSGIDREQLSTAERAYAHETLARALAQYRDAYLLEMRSYLDEEQFRRLSDYEHTEIALELQRAQELINRK